MAVHPLQGTDHQAIYGGGRAKEAGSNTTQDRAILSSLPDSTGGAAYFPQSLNDLNDISRTIGRDIRSRYVIGYKSTNPNQNHGYRSIQVQAQAPGYRQLTVRTRSGYYAGDAVH